MKKYILLLCLLGMHLAGRAQTGLSAADSALLYPAKKNIITKMLEKGFAILPVAFYSPETKLGGGIAGFYYFRLGKDSTTRPSSINLAAIYTQNRQLIFQVPFQLSLEGNKTLINGEAGVYRYPFQFYGIANDVDLDKSELYEPNIVRIKLNYLKQIKPKMYVGPYLRYEFQDMRPFDINGRLANEDFLGEEGGHVLGLGASFLYDRRNNIFTPTEGSYINVTAFASHESVGSDYGMTDAFLDARKYFPLGETKKHSLATQFYFHHQTGDVPFFLLAEMGGYYRMRGYFQGAYRAKFFTTAQAEWRFPLFWRLSGVAFGSVGQVANEVELSRGYLQYAGGAGLRVLFNDKENINLRVDYAIGKQTSGFYLTVAEAF